MARFLSSFLVTVILGAGRGLACGNEPNPAPDSGQVILHIDYAHGAESMDDLVRHSKRIVEGEVVELLGSRWSGRSYVSTVVTDYRIRITRSFLPQDKSERELIYTQMGGMLDGTEYVVPELLPVKLGARLLLFLYLPQPSNDPYSKGFEHTAFNGHYGIYFIDGQSVTCAYQITPAIRALARQGKDKFCAELIATLKRRQP